MNLIVAKFGGSSVANTKQVEKVAAIIKDDPRRRIIIVSAPGKRSPRDEKITDILISCHNMASEDKDFRPRFTAIRERFIQLSKDLGMGTEIHHALNEVEQNIADISEQAVIISRGEYLGAKLIAAYLGFEFVDATELIEFSPTGQVNTEKTDKLIANRLRDASYIIPGFYGAMPGGEIQLFSRGGSDISAALVARGVNARLYENWTDVSGLLSADPRIVHNPHPLGTISYQQLREMAKLGANVFHPEAVLPAEGRSIPINIRNTNIPSDSGTMIVPEKGALNTSISIAGNMDFTSIFARTTHNDPQLISRWNTWLSSQNCEQWHSGAGSDSLLAFVRGNGNWEELKGELNLNSLTVDKDMAIVGLVGHSIARNTALISRVLEEFHCKGISLYALAQHSLYTCFFVIPNLHYERAMNTVYDVVMGE